MTDFCLKQGKGLGSLYVPGKLPITTPPLSQHFALSEK